ncbi:MAG: tryptophan-rich sensory protein [Clostridia bacterium]|nr:tryptophan-rich sensory protein [Clostridia bacterium]
MMRFVKTIRLRPLLASLLLPLGLGSVVGVFLLLTGQYTAYDTLFKPPLAPPDWVFAVAWTVLYTLMGISAYLVATSDASKGAKEDALWQYFIQLVINLIWPFLFFFFSLRLAAFLWLVVLLAAVVRMVIAFWFLSKPAALLQIPYVLWLCFAAYLNGAVYLLNG